MAALIQQLATISIATLAVKIAGDAALIQSPTCETKTGSENNFIRNIFYPMR